MLKTQDCFLHETHETFLNEWCVYEVWRKMNPDPIAPADVIYLGCTRLADVYRTPDLGNNKLWHQLVKADTEIMIRVIRTGGHVECYNERVRLLPVYAPFPACNDVKYQITTGGRFKIKCLETDRVFKNQSETAQVMNLTQSQISAHLNGRAESVKGWHFVKVFE